jgi:hypothetical protein
MSNLSDTMKKREKLQSKGQQQQEKTYNQEVDGMDTEHSKGAESERGRSNKRLSTGA